MEKKQKQPRRHPAQDLAAKRNWIFGRLKHGILEIQTMGDKMHTLFVDIPYNDSAYSTAQKKLREAINDLVIAERLVEELFATYKANGETQPKGKINYGKVRHQQI